MKGSLAAWAALCAFGLLALGAAEAAEFDVYPQSGLVRRARTAS